MSAIITDSKLEELLADIIQCSNKDDGGSLCNAIKDASDHMIEQYGYLSCESCGDFYNTEGGCPTCGE